MAIEIERKFLVASEDWRPLVARQRRIRQAYLTKSDRISIRVRIDDDITGTLTIKTSEPGIARNEYEYSIPITDAEELLQRRDGAVIGKVRHIVPLDGLVWEIDVFEDDNQGLVIAEVELDRADRAIGKPSWLGEEVTGERRYYNADLAKRPFRSW